MLRRTGLLAAIAVSLAFPATAETVTNFQLANGLDVVVI